MELPERVTLPFSLEEFPEIIDVRSPAIRDRPYPWRH